MSLCARSPDPEQSIEPESCRSTPYPFKQPPDPAAVAARVIAGVRRGPPVAALAADEAGRIGAPRRPASESDLAQRLTLVAEARQWAALIR